MTKLDNKKLYRLCAKAEWETCQRIGHIPYNSDDSRDGFLHLSLTEQVERTARKYYTEVEDLLLLGISQKQIEPILRIEASSAGELYPHAYGQVPSTVILFARPVPQKQGIYHFPPELFQ
jgi:uncharacterized protein (DUF952 family)